MELWQQLLLGAVALLVIWKFGPGVKHAVENAPRGTGRDWLGLLLPIGAVVLFVLFLVATL